MIAQKACALDNDYRLFELLRVLHPHRSESLFTNFLPTGYKIVSFYRKEDSIAELLLRAKTMVGTLITFDDDLSDHPNYFDLEALEFLYDVRKKIPRNPKTRCNIYVSRLLHSSILDYAKMLPHYERYKKLFDFDLDQFANSNLHSAMQRLYPFLQNLVELKHFGPFNMGMVAVATLDLMAIGELHVEELRAVREASYLGQRAGRISNVMTTIEREKSLEDYTNEALVGLRTDSDYMGMLAKEHAEILETIKKLHVYSDKVNFLGYAEGVQRLHELHFRSKGYI